MFNFLGLFGDDVTEKEKQRERQAIRAFISAKKPRIKTIRTTSKERFKEIVDAMHNQTSNVLPNALAGALTGQTADVASKFLKDIKKAKLKTPVKGA